jgi:hypothetical protein
VVNLLTDFGGSGTKQQEQMKCESQKRHLVWSEDICSKREFCTVNQPWLITLHTTNNASLTLRKTALSQTPSMQKVARMEQNRLLRFRRIQKDDIKLKLKKKADSVGWI